MLCDRGMRGNEKYHQGRHRPHLVHRRRLLGRTVRTAQCRGNSSDRHRPLGQRRRFLDGAYPAEGTDEQAGARRLRRHRATGRRGKRRSPSRHRMQAAGSDILPGHVFAAQSTSTSRKTPSRTEADPLTAGALLRRSHREKSGGGGGHSADELDHPVVTLERTNGVPSSARQPAGRGRPRRLRVLLPGERDEEPRVLVAAEGAAQVVLLTARGLDLRPHSARGLMPRPASTSSRRCARPRRARNMSRK